MIVDSFPMLKSLPAIAGRHVTLLIAAVLLPLALASCGGGAVSAESSPTLPFQVSPSSATLYSGVSATISVSGGGARAPYTFTSSNAQLAPVPTSAVQSTSITVTPGNVSSAQSITITARDQAGNSATSALTLQPNLVSTDLTVAGTAAVVTGITNCSETGSVCVGQSGTATVTLTQFGAPAGGRNVRFETLQGNFRFPTDTAQTQFASSVNVTTDSSGKAVAILRADAGQGFQTAIIRATDTTTGAFRTSAFFIRQATVAGAEFSTVPAAYAASGIYKNECPGGAVDFLIFGGQPPYAVRSTSPSATFAPSLTPNENPSRFSVFYPAASCGTDGYDQVFTVTDGRAQTIQARITVKPGTEDRPAAATPLPTLALSTSSVNLPCTSAGGSSAQVIATIVNPGSTTPTITAALSTAVVPSNALTVLVPPNSNVITITRSNANITAPTGPTIAATVTVGAGQAGTQTIAVTTPATCP